MRYCKSEEHKLKAYIGSYTACKKKISESYSASLFHKIKIESKKTRYMGN